MKTPLLLVSAALLLPAQVKIPIEQYKLKNGLRVVLSRDNAVPAVATYLIYGIGSRAEEQGRTGFAHLFEHMMFQGTANAPKGFHMRSVQAAGGVLNASTHPDYTDYYQLVPSNKLPLVLWLEADRMRGLAINPENLKNQIDAVQEERRMRLENQPYMAAVFEKWSALAFENPHNQTSIIGTMEDLAASNTEHVAQFFKTYYAPNNAVLVIVGDIQPAETKKTIESYFGGIPSQPQPKHPDLSEPKPQVESAVHRDPLARVPGVIAGYPGPKRRSPEYYAMAMLDVILTGGDSSRFAQNLVKGRESVLQYQVNPGWPFQDASDYVDPARYTMFLLHKPNFTGKQVVEQAQEIIDSITEKGVPAEELNRARTFFRSARLHELESALNRAQLLGKYALLDNDPNLINTEMDQLLAVTPAQIQAFAKEYLRPEKRYVLEIAPAPQGPPPAAPPAPKKEGN
jgi:predicted Zn-dependent peptidase